MKKSFLIKYIAALLCFILVAASLSLTSLAANLDDEENSYSITLVFAHDDEPISNVHFRLYRIADSVENLENGNLLGKFADYDITVPSPLDVDSLATLAATLSSYAARDALVPSAQGSTNSEGKLEFSGLAKGVYLIDGNSAEVDGDVFIPHPFIVSLPQVIDGEVQTKVTAKIKYEYIPSDEETIERKVIKVWDDGNYPSRPTKIVAQLLKDGVVYDEVTLNEENNWRHTWSDLDPSSIWQVVEKTVPDGYTVTVSRDGVSFVLTNKFDEDTPDEGWPTEPTEPSDTPNPPDKGDDLPNTGLLWWPVPVLIVAGFVVFGIGFFTRKRIEDEEA